MHSSRRDSTLGCSIKTSDPYTSQPIHTSCNFSLYRSKAITEDELSYDDLLNSEWYIDALFAKDPEAVSTKFDEEQPDTTSRILTAKSHSSDEVEALLVMENITSLREYATMFEEWVDQGGDIDSDQHKLNKWRFQCDSQESSEEILQ